MNRVQLAVGMCFLVLMVLLPSSEIFSQSKSTNGQIRINYLLGRADSEGDEGGADYRINTWFNGTINSNCVDFSNISRGVWHTVQDADKLRVNRTITIDQEQSFDLEFWEEDGCGGGCGYNTGCGGADEDHCGRSAFLFRFYDYHPGNHPENIFNRTYCQTLVSLFPPTLAPAYEVEVEIYYAMPTPLAPRIRIDGTSLSGSSGNVCNNPVIELSTLTSVNPAFNSEITYTWEYRIYSETSYITVDNPAFCPNGYDDCFPPSLPPPPGWTRPACCNEPPTIQQAVDNWRPIGTTNAANNEGITSFRIRDLAGLQNITENQQVEFRVRATANGSTSSASSASYIINLSPLPPTVESINPLPSCPNSATGIIELKNMRGTGNYEWILKAGFNNVLPCDPESDNSCFSAPFSGSTSGLTDSIENIATGQYTLWLANNGGTNGVCYSTQNVEVLAIPKLAVGHASPPLSVTCNGASMGEIRLTYTGGIAPYTYSLTKGGILSGSNSSGEFLLLSAGDYVASVTDGCGQTYPETLIDVKITQPAKVSESIFNATNATCNLPGNGDINVTVTKSSGTYDISLSSTYSYKLTKGGQGYDSLESTDPSAILSDLIPGNDYELIVTEKGGSRCNGYVKSFSIASPPALSVTNISINDVSCYAGTNGNVSFDGSGGSGDYLFKMTRTAGDTIQNTTGDFSNLQSGDYTLVIHNALSGCQDKQTYSSFITVDQPDKINADLTKTDISCYGKDDGSIAAVITGGTPGYTGVWQQLIGSSWASLSNTGTVINDRQAGTYRLRVTDSKACIDSSLSVTIIEPALLQISNVSVQDIKCFNEQGQINVTSTGGTGTYSYFYSMNSGVFTAFTNTTPLNAGSYVVKVNDANGCTHTDPGTHNITSPPTALDFSYVQSDFNGYNISCFGGSNGSITLTPTGGNGGTYTGYQYARNNGAFQQLNLIEGFNAGNHIVSVIDNRGCIVSKNIQFTQTNAEIALSLKSKQDIACFGDKNGVLELQASGGLSPYVFSLDNGTKQSSPIFSSLAADTYYATVFDKNNCDASVDYTIDIINPPIEISSSIKDVSCFDGKDGSITVTINGGVNPLQYQWKDQANTTAVLSNAKAGAYTILVTDNAGCKRDSIFSISQPAAALQAQIAVVPVCFGRTNGIITITPGGGTSPYQYSVDNGQTYQAGPVFNTVGVGQYAVKVVDNNGCVSTGTANIIQRNDKPLPNFTVATKEYALDTLVIREISLPKPDSVHWIFDPAATIVKNDAWLPEIVFKEAGEYVVTMIGYFQACDYSITHTITLKPFDPNAVPSKEPSVRAIESVEVTPNPNSGEFDVTIKLNKKYRLSLIVYDVLGATHYNKSWEDVQEAAERITLPNASAGVYLLRAVTNSDARDIRIIINK